MEKSTIIKTITKKIRVKNGSCPNGHSLMSDDVLFDGQRAVAVNVRSNGNSSTLYLNPFYGKFEYKCSLELKIGEVVDMTCPTCGVSLLVEEMCKICNVKMFAIHLPDGGQVEGCPKVGCHNHSLTIVDLDAQLERMYVDETKVMM